MMNICTISTTSHLPQAIVMANSVKKHMPQCRLILCLLEREKPKLLEDIDCFDSILLAKNIGFKNFENYIFKYSAAPACFSLKGKLLLYLFDKYPYDETFIYLDSDLQIFSPFDEVFSALHKNPIILTPHLLRSLEREIHIWRETGILQTGMFNAGFLAVRKCSQSRQFLSWWNYRLEKYCYSDIKNGICFDQRWLDLVPGLFDVTILKHPGYNAAWWNLSERKIKRSQDGSFLVLGKPLRFFHFSGLEGRLEQMIHKWYSNKEAAKLFFSLKHQYIKQLETLEREKYKKISWTYGFYKSGEEIKERSRNIYRKNETFMKKKYGNPFKLSNKNFFSFEKNKHHV